jgi:methyl halide transferase
MDEIQCCTVSCEKPLNQNYWDAQYQAKTTGWDLGVVSPPLKAYIESLEDKNIRVLIPGCGNTYEAEYLLEKGFTKVTVIDIAPTLVSFLRKKFEHDAAYDLIFEQTFFCALPPTMRQRYVWKMHQLLAPKGILVGLLFNRTFEAGPPFGGSKEEYQSLFNSSFDFKQFDVCQNSVAPRANSELFVALQKNNAVVVNLFKFKGINCSACLDKIIQKIRELDTVLNVSISSDFSTLLLVSNKEVLLSLLQQQIAFDVKYSIEKMN